MLCQDNSYYSFRKESQRIYMNKITFTGTISKNGWTFITWPESATRLGTGKAVKVMAMIEGHDFAVTCLPTGDGTHFLPLNKAVMKAIGKMVGDVVEVEVWKD